MSPGPTFERVYLELKRQLREGSRPPGAPLEPTAIGDELGSSFTPVRDALHRLVGEGLVENPRHNGFAVPRLTEMALRDLYAWNGDAVALVASRSKGPLMAPPATVTAGETETASATAALFLAMAEASGNREHARTITQLNERLAPYRRIEAQTLASVADELTGLRAIVGTPRRAEWTRALTRYHRRRIEAAPKILAILQAGV